MYKVDKRILIPFTIVLIIVGLALNKCMSSDTSSNKSISLFKYYNNGDYLLEDQLGYNKTNGVGLFVKSGDKFYGLAPRMHDIYTSSADDDALSQLSADNYRYFTDREKSVAVTGENYYNVIHKYENDTLIFNFDGSYNFYLLPIIDEGYLETYSVVQPIPWFKYNYINGYLINQENETIDQTTRLAKVTEAVDSLGIHYANGLFLAAEPLSLTVGTIRHNQTTEKTLSFKLFTLVASLEESDIIELSSSDWTNGYKTLDTSGVPGGKYLLIRTNSNLTEWVTKPPVLSYIYQLIIE